MKLILAIPLLLLITLMSCEKSDSSKNPDIPNNDSIDVNNDSQFDFVIKYIGIATTDIPPSHQSITGVIRPLNGNQVLYRHPDDHLYLQENDTIRKENNLNSNWSENSASLVGINGDRDKWEKDWSVISALHSDYYLGIKLNGDTEYIGWILFNFNTSNGEISIIDKELTESNELIIKK